MFQLKNMLKKEKIEILLMTGEMIIPGSCQNMPSLAWPGSRQGGSYR